MVVGVDRGAQMVANMKKDQRACRVGAALVLLVLTVNFNFDVTVQLQRILFSELGRGSPTDYHTRHKSRELLDKLREASRLAADGHDYQFTDADRAAWHAQNPCQSRSELPAMFTTRKHIRDISPNPIWEQVLDEYSNLHRICMKRVDNLTAHFLSKSNMTIPGCKFLVAEGQYGLGNKMLVTISALLYSIVSQRVILVPSKMSFRAVLCEPFMGSSWFLEEDTFPMPDIEKHNDQIWVEGPVFVDNLNHRLKFLKEELESGDNPEPKAGNLPPLVDAIMVSSIWPRQPWYPDKWFFCKTEQRYLSQVPWMYFSGCIYSIPDLYGSTAFGPMLQALFPDRMVATRLLRSTFLPSDSVWSRFKHLNHVYFQQADRRVSVQLRFFDDSYKTMREEMNERVLDCAITNGLLPSRNDSASTEAPISPPPSAPITTIFIASLYSDLHDSFSDFYLRNPTATGEAVGVVQITSQQEQLEGTEEDTEALVEMLLLSLSDSLIVTPVSTFGQIGQAYGGLTPWLVRSTTGEGPSCERGQTVDPCQQKGYPGNECSNDPPSSSELDGLLENCLKIDLGQRIVSGVQILDNHLSWQEAQRDL